MRVMSFPPEPLVPILGRFTTTGNNSEVRFLCPFCDQRGHTRDRQGHLYLNTRKGLWICFRCAATGHYRAFLEDEEIQDHYLGTLDDAIEALESLSKDDRPPVVTMPYETTRPAPGTTPFRYLASRGLTEDDIEFYNLVWGTPYTVHGAIPRIFVPVYDGDRLVYWTGRRFGLGNPRAPRYLNPTGADKERVFNLDRTAARTVLIVEGPFTAMRVGRDATAIFGKTATVLQVRHLLDRRVDEYVVVMDGDAHHQTVSLAATLFCAGKRASVLFLGEDESPDEVPDLRLRLDDRIPVTMEFLAEHEMGAA